MMSRPRMLISTFPKTCWGSKVRVIQKVLRVFMAGWTAVYVTYHVPLVLMTLGPTNFNGDPKQPIDYIFEGLEVALIAGLIYAIPQFVKGNLRKALYIAVPSAFLPWAASAVVHGAAGGLVVPFIYCGGILLLIGMYWLTKRQDISKDTGKNRENTHE